jgi:hypothetical protein
MSKKKRALLADLAELKNNTHEDPPAGSKLEEYSIYNNNKEAESGSDSESPRDEDSSFELEPDEKKSTEQDQKNIEKLLDRLGLKTANNGVNKHQELELVVNNFVENCIETVDHEANAEEYDHAYDALYQERLKTHEPYLSAIYISELTQLESIERLSSRGVASIYRTLMLAKRYTSMACQQIV